MMAGAHVGSQDLTTGLGPSTCLRTSAVRSLQDALVFEPCPYGSPDCLAGRYAVPLSERFQPVNQILVERKRAQRPFARRHEAATIVLQRVITVKRDVYNLPSPNTQTLSARGVI